LKIAAVCLLIMSLAGCAKVATPDRGAQAAIEEPRGEGRLALQSFATPPYAFTHFCLRYADECRVHEASFENAHDSWGDIADVNNEVNGAIAPHANPARMNYDTWRISPPSGDCNDYAVTKRHELLDLGWPSRSLLLAEVVTRQGEHHLVLVVRADGRDLVLDNLTSSVRDASETSYEWVRMQSPDNPKLWLSVAGA